MKEKDIHEYLHFGYLPVKKNSYPFDISAVTTGKEPEDGGQDLSKMHELFTQIIRGHATSKPMVVPLSGGTDSRLILAALYREFGPENITAVTFGIPGNLDVILAKKITARFNISHRFINLLETDFSEEKLVDFARSKKVPTLLMDAYFNHLVREYYGKNVVYFSGFIGDRIAGSVPKHLWEINNFEKAGTLFLKNNRYDKAGFLPGLRPSDFTIHNDEYSFLPLYEKIDYRIRQVNMTMPVILDEQYDIRTPLIDPEWISFMYSLPGRFRDGQSLFFEMAATCYPDFFRIGVKNFYGAPVKSSKFQKSISRKICYGRRILHKRFPRIPVTDPLINYTDPFWFYIKNQQTAKMVEKNISDLTRRSIFKLDPGIALAKLKQGRMEYKQAVELLFTLEIYLKAGFFK